jgi:hypothetical protein
VVLEKEWKQSTGSKALLSTGIHRSGQGAGIITILGVKEEGGTRRRTESNFDTVIPDEVSGGGCLATSKRPGHADEE